MDNKVEFLKEIKNDFIKNINNICKYHNVDEEKVILAEDSIDGFFEFITGFYEIDNDSTGKKALVMDFVSNYSDSNNHLPIKDFFQSSIEYLLFSSLQNSMPKHIWEKAYLLPQVNVCNDKYILDIALMERKSYETDGVEGVPIIGIECDGYDTHYSDPEKATKTNKRIREIEMTEGIKVFNYTGKEIYSDCINLAKEFWEYVEKNYYSQNNKEAFIACDKYEISYCDLPSKAILKYRDMFVKVSVRAGSVTQDMINILLNFINCIYDMDLSKNEILAVRTAWFDTKNANVLISVDYLLNDNNESKYDETGIKALLGDNEVNEFGYYCDIDVKIKTESFASDYFFVNDDKFYKDDSD